MSGDQNGREIDLTGQVALVTGGGRGLGQAFAQALAAVGASVAITARSEDQLSETLRLIEDQGRHGIAIPADVSDPNAVERLVAAVEDQLGPVDLLVNNAGIPGPMTGFLWEVDPDEWWRTLEINLRGPYLCARAVLPAMIARRHGRIINMSSGSAYNTHPIATAYASSKAALTHLTKCLASSTEEYGVSVFAYAPGVVRTALLEYIAYSPEVPESFQKNYLSRLEEGIETPMERAVEMFMFLASGNADALSGCLIRVDDDESELMRRGEEIKKGGLYTLARRT